MVFLLDVFGMGVANVFRTSEVLRRPGSGRDGGARSEDAVSDGGGAGTDSGVSQNM